MPLGKIYYRAKLVHVELVSNTMVETNFTTKKFIKGESIRKVNFAKIRLTPTMARKQSYQTQEKYPLMLGPAQAHTGQTYPGILRRGRPI